MRVRSHTLMAVFCQGPGDENEWIAEGGLGLVLLDVRESTGLQKRGFVTVARELPAGGSIDLPQHALWAAHYRLAWFQSKTHNAPAAGVFGVLARWLVAVEAADLFEAEVVKNGRASLIDEDGCLAFGYCSFRKGLVCNLDRSPLPPNQEYLLIECFKSSAAFAVHLESHHFLAFRAAVLPFFLGDRRTTIQGDAIAAIGRLLQMAPLRP